MGEEGKDKRGCTDAAAVVKQLDRSQAWQKLVIPDKVVTCHRRP